MRVILSGCVLAVFAAPRAALACAACYGASDAPMAKGMNWGILSLLAIIGVVLSGVASFFVYLGVRSTRSSIVPLPKDSSESSETL